MDATDPFLDSHDLTVSMTNISIISTLASKNVLDHAKPVTVKFITQEGGEKVITGPSGQDILTLAHENNIDLEGRDWVI
jgi:hypothetical protein